MKYNLLFLFCFFFVYFQSQAQEISVKERAEITYQAELLIGELENLLNIISNSDISSSEINELISNSYGNSKNKIFYNSSIIVEEDINPLYKDHINPKDVGIEKYLKDFDLLYVKSPEASISFKEIKTSSLKKKNYLFVRVYFESFFNGKNKEIKQTYVKTKRVAEVRADKINNHWKTYIVSITFDDPARPISSTQGNVILAANTVVSVDSTTGEKPTQAAMEELVKIETRKLFEGYKVKRDSAYNIAMRKGNQALQDKNYMVAIESFTEAQNINPYEITPKIQINEVTRTILHEKQNEQNSIETLKKNGDKAQFSRDYDNAKNYYQQALSKMPNDTSLIHKIRDLDKVIRAKAQLESKFKSGDYEAALKDYNLLIKDNKKNPDYYVGRGKVYQKLNDPKKALVDYSEAIRLDLNFIEAIEMRAKLYTEFKEYHNAIADYSVLVSADKSDATPFAERAKVKLLLNDLEGAEKDFDEAIKISPKNNTYLYEKGLINMKLRKPEKARLDFERAINIDSSFGNYFYFRGLANLGIDKVQQAGIDFNKAKSRKLEDAYTNHINEIANDFFKKGQEALKSKDFKVALNHTNNALLLQPRHEEALIQHGDILYEMKKYDDAIDSYEEAIELNDKLYLPYYKLAQTYFNTKEYEEVVENAEKANKLNNSFLPSILLQGKGLWIMGKNAESIALLNRAMEKFPANAEIYWYLGKSYYNLKNYKKSIEELENSIRKNSSVGEVYYDLGLSHMAISDYKSAVRDYSKSIELGYEPVQVYFNIGMAYMGNKEYDLAIKCFSFSLDKDKNHPGNYRQRGKAYVKLKQYDLALKDYNSALQNETGLLEDVDFLTEKGFVELNQNHPKEALETFGAILADIENKPDALYGKACALVMLGKEEEALIQFENAFKSSTMAWTSIKNDPYLQPIVKNKKFQDLVKKYL